MVLTVHHLHISQSERVLWLLEELGLDYRIIHHTRSPVLSPDSLLSLKGNEAGTSPFIEDPEAGVTLFESEAVINYIIQKYGNGKFSAKPSDPYFADYLHWFSKANGTLQPDMLVSMFMSLSQTPEEHPIRQFAQQRFEKTSRLYDERLASSKWLAGDVFTAADIMTVYSFATQRYFGPLFSLAPYNNILRWLQDCAAREGYQRAVST